MSARSILVSGVVQGVGFRPFVFRLATSERLGGWVLNGADGVEIHVEGTAAAVQAFGSRLVTEAPPAARIASVDIAAGVFQNALLLADLKLRCDALGVRVWTNRQVPANDGGISLGQAAFAATACDAPP